MPSHNINKVFYWISLTTYTNVCWSVYLSPIITWLLLRTKHILHNVSHTIYIFVLYFLMFSSIFVKVWEIFSKFPCFKEFFYWFQFLFYLFSLFCLYFLCPHLYMSWLGHFAKSIFIFLFLSMDALKEYKREIVH